MPKNIALIFAGGTGIRMNSRDIPKQFLILHGKEIIVHTIEKFQSHEEIDGIVVVCLGAWINHMRYLTKKFHLTKVLKIVEGGKSGQDSIYKGLKMVNELFDSNDIVLIHDGVRPIINSSLISENIQSVKKNGTGITVAPSVETIVTISDSNKVDTVNVRDHSMLAKAPQCFLLHQILSAHEQSINDNMQFIDSASMMAHYGYELFVVKGSHQNIKITTPIDFFIYRAIIDIIENKQIND